MVCSPLCLLVDCPRQGEVAQSDLCWKKSCLQSWRFHLWKHLQAPMVFAASSARSASCHLRTDGELALSIVCSSDMLPSILWRSSTFQSAIFVGPPSNRGFSCSSLLFPLCPTKCCFVGRRHCSSPQPRSNWRSGRRWQLRSQHRRLAWGCRVACRGHQIFL